MVTRKRRKAGRRRKTLKKGYLYAFRVKGDLNGDWDSFDDAGLMFTSKRAAERAIKRTTAPYAKTKIYQFKGGT